MKKLLFFYPSNKRSNSIETMLLELRKRGYPIKILTTAERGPLHDYLEEEGFDVFINCLRKRNPLLYYIRQIYFLVKFCKKQQISLVMSHLQHANIISVFAQFFTKSDFMIFRHQFKFHVFSNDTTELENKYEKLFDSLINRLAKKVIVPSVAVKNAMIEFENARPEKLSVIPYLYDFSSYQMPDVSSVNEIKLKYHCHLLILLCSRLIKPKRHYLVLPVLRKIIDEGKDIKVLILDEGPEKSQIEHYIETHELSERIFLLGHRPDFLSYMAASDLLIHPSLSEASNSAVKEMGFMGNAVAVCSKVGDFEEYIQNGYNGFLMSPLNTELEVEQIVRTAYADKELLKDMGNRLKQSVIDKFHKSKDTLDLYVDLIETFGK